MIDHLEILAVEAWKEYLIALNLSVEEGMSNDYLIAKLRTCFKEGFKLGYLVVK
jgi:hypothetical protein